MTTSVLPLPTSSARKSADVDRGEYGGPRGRHSGRRGVDFEFGLAPPILKTLAHNRKRSRRPRGLARGRPFRRMLSDHPGDRSSRVARAGTPEARWSPRPCRRRTGSVNMVVGASYGGVPAMTVTSGPGLSLMVETIGLQSRRKFRSSSWTSCAAGLRRASHRKRNRATSTRDLRGAWRCAPRCAGTLSVADCMLTAEWAVYIAESLQAPVIVLSDQSMGQAQAVIDPALPRPQPLRRILNGGTPGAVFKRYAIGPDPVTPMPLPGTAGRQWVGEGLNSQRSRNSRERGRCSRGANSKASTKT